MKYSVMQTLTLEEYVKSRNLQVKSSAITNGALALVITKKCFCELASYGTGDYRVVFIRLEKWSSNLPGLCIPKEEYANIKIKILVSEEALYDRIFRCNISKKVFNRILNK